MGRRHRGGPPEDLPNSLFAFVEETEDTEVVIRPLEGRPRVFWCAEVREEHEKPLELGEVTAQEALEEGLTVVEDLPEKMPCVISYSAIGGGDADTHRVKVDNACIRLKKGETYKAFLRRLRNSGEAGEYFARASSRVELERLGVNFPGEDDAEFGDTWLDG